MQVMEVRARISATETAPITADGTTVVATGSAFFVHFDRFLDPRTAIRQAYCLRSETDPVESFEDCEQAVSTSPRYDPVTRTLSIYLDGNESELEPNTLYTLTLLAPRDGTDIGLRAFDQAALLETRAFQFTTGEPAEGVVDLPPPSPSCVEVRAVFSRGQCRTCHAGTEPAEGFFIPVVANELPSIVGRTAHETSLDGHADEPEARPTRFGANMPIVDAQGSAGNSYLLYKVLAAQPGRPEDLADGEIERLRSSVVVGLPMPALPDIEPLSEDDLIVLSTWISSGATCE